MATIRATCGDCGDVVLGSGDVKVLVFTHDSSASYTFRCPTCSMVVVKPARGRTVDLLVASGVAMSSWDYPAELDEPRGDGDAISHDELLDFHRALQDDDRFGAALLELRGERR